MCKCITLEEIEKLLIINSKRLNETNEIIKGNGKSVTTESDLTYLAVEKDVLTKLLDYIALKELNNKER